MIWANHALRAAITAMRAVCRRIRAEQSVAGIEAEIASVRDIFDLVDNQELEAAEARYLPRQPGREAAD